MSAGGLDRCLLCAGVRTCRINQRGHFQPTQASPCSVGGRRGNASRRLDRALAAALH